MDSQPSSDWCNDLRLLRRWEGSPEMDDCMRSDRETWSFPDSSVFPRSGELSGSLFSLHWIRTVLEEFTVDESGVCHQSSVKSWLVCTFCYCERCYSGNRSIIAFPFFTSLPASLFLSLLPIKMPFRFCISLTG